MNTLQTHDRPNRRRGARILAAAAAVCGLVAASEAHGQIRTWLAAESGSWTDGTRWSGGVFPNNPFATALIDRVGAAYSVSLADNITIGTLSLASADATLAHMAGSFSTNLAVIRAGSYLLNGGAMGAATIDLRLGSETVAQLTQNGGSLKAARILLGQLTAGAPSGQTGTIHLAGGISAIGYASIGQSCALNLTGGIHEIGIINLHPTAVFDLTGGTLSIRGLADVGGPRDLSIGSPAQPTLRLSLGSTLVNHLRVGTTAGGGRVMLDEVSFLQCSQLTIGSTAAGTVAVAKDGYLKVGSGPNVGTLHLGNNGTLIVRSGGRLTVDALSGAFHSGLQFDGGTDVGTVAILSSAGVSMQSPASLTTLLAGKTLEVPNGPINLAATASLSLNGGMVRTQAIVRSPDDSNLQLTSGTLELLDPTATTTVGDSGVLPRLQLLNTGTTAAFINAGTTMLVGANPLQIAGGHLRAARLIGPANSLQWTSGLVALNEYDMLADQVLGLTRTLNAGMKLDVGSLTVGPAASLTLAGGVLNASRLLNSGLLHVQAGSFDASGTFGVGGGGTLLIAGGTTHLAGDVVVGTDGGSSGAGTVFKGGGVTTYDRQLRIGAGLANGSVIQSGGQLVARGVNALLQIGVNGSYSISGGILDAGAAGILSQGAFHQSNGMVLADNLSAAQYYISGGTLDVSRDDSASDLSPRLSITTLQQEGGLVQSHRAVILGSSTLSGGTLKLDELTIDRGQLSQSGGSLDVRFTLNVTRDSKLDITGGVATLDNLAVFQGGQVDIRRGIANVNAVSMDGGQLNIAGGATGFGDLRVGAGGIVLGGDSPGILIGTDSVNSGVPEINGPVRSVVRSGVATIGAAPIGIDQDLPTFDLGDEQRIFAADDGDSPTDLRILVPITNGGVHKTGMGQMTIASTYAGNDGLRVDAGTLVLQGLEPNSFTGSIDLRGGTLVVSSNSQLGSSNNQINFNGGALRFEGPSGTPLVSNRQLNVASTGTLDIQNAVDFTGTLTGSGALVVQADGTLAVRAQSPFAGRLDLRRGVVSLLPNALPNLGTLTVYPGGSLNSATIAVAPSAILDLRGGQVELFQSFGGLTVSAGGSELSGSVSFANITEDYRRGGAALDIKPASTVRFPANLPFDPIGRWATVGYVDFARYIPATGEVKAFDPGQYQTGTFLPNTHMSVSGNQTVGSISVLSLRLTGTLVQNFGTALTISQGGLLVPPNANSAIGGGTLVAGSSATPELAIAIGPNSTLSISSAIASPPGVQSSLLKSGPGVLVLGGGFTDSTANTFTGTTYVNRGTLLLNKAPGTNAIPGDLEINGGAVIHGASEQIPDDATVRVNAGTYELRGFNETIGSLINTGGRIITGPGTLSVTSANTMTLNGGTTIIGSGRIIQTSGFEISGGVNTIERAARVEVTGVLGVRFTDNEGPNPTLTLVPDSSAPGTLALFNNAPIRSTGTLGTANLGGNNSAGEVDLRGGTSNIIVSDDGINDGDVNMIITAVIRNGAIIKQGNGTLRLTAANLYDKGTRIQEGLLEVTSPQSLGSGSVTLEGGGLKVLSDGLATSFSQTLVTNSAVLDFSRLTPGTGGGLALPAVIVAGNQKVLSLAGNSGGLITIGSFLIGQGTTVDTGGLVDMRVNALAGNGTSSLIKRGPRVLKLGTGMIAPTNVGTIDIRAGTVEAALVGVDRIVVNNSGTYRGSLNVCKSLTMNPVGGAATFELTGPSIIDSFTFQAGGTVVLSGASTLAVNQNTNYSAGALGGGTLLIDRAKLDLIGSAPNIPPTVVDAPALRAIAGGRLRVGQGDSPNSTAKIMEFRSIDIAGSGSGIDLANNGLLVDYSGPSSPRAQIESLIASGYANGVWNGDGIISSSIVGVPGARLSLAVADAAEVFYTFPADFHGKTVDNTTVLVKFSLSGDANLDGIVNIDDFSAIAANFNLPGRWRSGDFDFNGMIGLGDFALLGSNFNQVISARAQPPAAAVPEPAAGLALLLLASLRRRRCASISD